MKSENQINEIAYYLTKTFMHSILKEYIDENQLMQIMQHLGLKTQEEYIYFLTQLTITLRKYPDSVFSSNEVRVNFINIIQEFLDAKILEENN